MGLFGSKSETEKLLKHLQSNNYQVTTLDNEYKIELSFKDDNISLYPYFKIDEKEKIFSICINIKKVANSKELNYDKVIEFNNISRFYRMKVEKNIYYLEYSCYFKDNLIDLFDKLIENVFMVYDEIKSL